MSSASLFLLVLLYAIVMAWLVDNALFILVAAYLAAVLLILRLRRRAR